MIIEATCVEIGEVLVTVGSDESSRFTGSLRKLTFLRTHRPAPQGSDVILEAGSALGATFSLYQDLTTYDWIVV